MRANVSRASSDQNNEAIAHLHPTSRYLICEIRNQLETRRSLAARAELGGQCCCLIPLDGCGPIRATSVAQTGLSDSDFEGHLSPSSSDGMRRHALNNASSCVSSSSHILSEHRGSAAIFETRRLFR